MDNSTEKYGVENLTAAIKTIGISAVAYHEIIEDEKVSFWEILSLRDEFKLAKKDWKKRKEIALEISDISNDEAEYIYNEIQNHFECNREEAKEIFFGAVETYNGIKRIVKNVKTLKSE
ncbi:hypothetical protein [Chondrinema litorale]|uniref:hypothetical protein n=1 Tax=Chondrinema litorale TaxID=2994555 RepID=UPI002543C8D7|nr:hypothetical protein [Chondrinema litorale]UZR95929.1 hypothetical protein OQ292_08900 [Chondrinema litorale]